MIITCNCGCSLTTDLYLTKQYDIDPNGPHGKDYSIKRGSFVKNTSYQDGKELLVNPRNVLMPKPEFKSGMGCCDLWGEHVVCPSCQSNVGYWMLDCHCDKRVEFFEKKVIRRYRK